MKLITSFYKSITNLSWLKSQKKAGGAAWGYFFLLSLIITIAFCVPVAARLPGFFNEFRQTFVDKIPEFTATIQDGQLSIQGIEQPYILRSGDNDKIAVIVDTVTTTPVRVQDFLQEDESGILVTKDVMEIYNNSNGQDKLTYWKDVKENVTTTRADVVSFANTFMGGWFIAFLSVLLLIFFYIFTIASKLFAILMVSVVLIIVSNIAKKGWTFGELFTVSLYATTLPSLIALILPWVGVNVSLLHFWGLLAFMLAVVFTKDAAESAPVQAPPQQ